MARFIRVCGSSGVLRSSTLSSSSLSATSSARVNPPTFSNYYTTFRQQFFLLLGNGFSEGNRLWAPSTTTSTLQHASSSPSSESTPRRWMSQTGICFAPFPRNELHILEFNMRQQLKQNQILVEKAVKQLIADMAHGDIPIVTDVKSCGELLTQRIGRQSTAREVRTCHEAVLSRFDEKGFLAYQRDCEAKLNAAVELAGKDLRVIIASAVERVVMTRNKAAMMLMKHLERYPDKEETEVFWNQRFSFPTVMWDEGGDFSRDAIESAVSSFGRSGNECL